MSAQAQVQEPVIECPGCGRSIALTQALTGPIREQEARKLEVRYQERDQRRQEELRRRLAEVTKKAVEKAKAAQMVDMTALREQVAEQQANLEMMQATEIELRKQARELAAREKALALEVDRKVDERCKLVEEETGRRVVEEHHLKDLAKDKQLADLRHQLEEATRRAQQGSQQLQGEVAELDLESQLRHAFPLDTFETIGTGQRGADIVHRVTDAANQVCGTVLYEVKNAKGFSDMWLPKLREDQRDQGAEIGVLVTTALPKDVSTFAQRGRVWVTGMATVLPLAHALRHCVVEAARARVAADGQAEKQAALAAYCGGTEFRQRIEAMLDPIAAMIDDLSKERRGIETAWARREKRYVQLAKAIAGLWGDVGGIMGTLPRLAKLELPPPAPEEGRAA